MPSASPVKPLATSCQASRPSWLEKPAKLFRTVPPSSMVRRLVARPSVEATLIVSAIASASAPSASRPRRPRRPCPRCRAGASSRAASMRCRRARRSRSRARSRGSHRRRSTSRISPAIRAAGTTWMPGWPRANWLPSSISSIVPAVPLSKAALGAGARRMRADHRRQGAAAAADLQQLRGQGLHLRLLRARGDRADAVGEHERVRSTTSRGRSAKRTSGAEPRKLGQPLRMAGQFAGGGDVHGPTSPDMRASGPDPRAARRRRPTARCARSPSHRRGSASSSDCTTFCSTSRIGKPVLVQPPDQREHLLDQQRRQAERRLVEDQQPRLGHQAAADREHLLLAAGQRAGGLRRTAPAAAGRRRRCVRGCGARRARPRR